MFEKLKDKKVSPYLLEPMMCNFVWCLILFPSFSLFCYHCAFTDLDFWLWCLGTLGFLPIACFLNLIEDRASVMYVLHDKRKNDVITKEIEILETRNDVIYQYAFTYLKYVFPDPDIARWRVKYKSDQGKGYFRIIVTVDKCELLLMWEKLDPEMKCEIDVYRKSRILKGIRPIDGHDYPEGVPEIIRIINQMYP